MDDMIRKATAARLASALLAQADAGSYSPIQAVQDEMAEQHAFNSPDADLNEIQESIDAGMNDVLDALKALNPATPYLATEPRPAHETMTNDPTKL